MPNYLLRLSFIGTNYAGWQIQPEVPTVQGTLTEALSKIFGESIKLIGCCRTDAGVHALDYVANFKAKKSIPPEKLLLALNSLLPKDIGIKEVREVGEDFNARYSVRGKTYLYRIWNSPARDPFLYPFCWQVPYPLNLEKLSEGARLLSGLRDFSGFCKLEEPKDTVIDLKVEVTVNKPLIEIRFRATHFLRYMVRRLVGALVYLASGKTSLDELKECLRGKHWAFTAPAKGLTLERVELPP